MAIGSIPASPTMQSRQTDVVSVSPAHGRAGAARLAQKSTPVEGRARAPCFLTTEANAIGLDPSIVSYARRNTPITCARGARYRPERRHRPFPEWRRLPERIAKSIAV